VSETIATTQHYDDETQTLELAITNDDVPALAALVGHYRASAALWRADAEEKGRTIETLKKVLDNYINLE
jgi:hypothetical protein